MDTTSTRYFSFYDIDTTQIDLLGDAFGINSSCREVLDLLEEYGPVLPDDQIIDELLRRIKDFY